MRASFYLWGERVMRCLIVGVVALPCLAALMLGSPLLWILFTVARPRLDDHPARTTQARVEARMLEDAVRIHRRRHGTLPTSWDELALVDAYGQSLINEQWHDPWGREYVLRPAEHRSGFEVRSAGPDGRMDTADDVSSVDR